MKRELRIDTPDFKAFEWELVDGPGGKKLWMSLCCELLAGRWESFYAVKEA